MNPIPPLTADAVINPFHLADTTNRSQPLSTPISSHPSTPPSSPAVALASKTRKVREKFTTRNKGNQHGKVEHGESSDSSTESNKRTRLTNMSHVHSAHDMARMVKLLEKKYERDHGESSDSSAESNEWMSHVHSARDMARMVKLLERKDEWYEQSEKATEIFHANLLEWQDRALVIQERTATSLLDILREALLK
ncbi:hypothetical protein JB92DRAFT_3098765 [Gautieria morchelliformis]|nr:hypothetical protein JB92DRAFT_3098765 [Gautieria morchelliformis]